MNDIVDLREARTVKALRDPDPSMSKVPNTIRQAIADVIEEQRAEIGQLRAAMDRYRYAISWTASDSWDLCQDCRARLEWALAMDPGERLTQDQIAAVGKAYLQQALVTESKLASSERPEGTP